MSTSRAGAGAGAAGTQAAAAANGRVGTPAGSRSTRSGPGGPGAVEGRLVAATEAVRATRDLPLTRDLALVAARAGLAWIFVYHGAVTLFGAFGGGGVHAQAEFFSSVAHLQPATFFAVLSGIIEFFGGLAVGLGVFGRLAALSLVGDMAVAMATVTFGNGIVSAAAGSGYEINVALLALALVVTLMGTGRYSVDVPLRALYRRWRQLP
ncbi:MAG TPA: DoxX family protein [Acidimicrobiales bacterium]|nr:DoxX family protein [Acidimicrobiales bacterium]